MASSKLRGDAPALGPLDCPLCMDLYFEPVVLPCACAQQRSICFVCLINLKEQNAGTVVCPYCKQCCNDTDVITDYHLEFKLEQHIYRLKSELRQCQVYQNDDQKRFLYEYKAWRSLAVNHSLHYPAVETPSDVIVGGDLTASSHRDNAATSKYDVTNEQLSDDNTEDLLDGVQLTAAHLPTSGADTDDDVSVGSAEFGLIPEADPFRTQNGGGVITDDLDLTDCIAATNRTEPSSGNDRTNGSKTAASDEQAAATSGGIRTARIRLKTLYKWLRLLVVGLLVMALMIVSLAYITYGITQHAAASRSDSSDTSSLSSVWGVIAAACAYALCRYHFNDAVSVLVKCVLVIVIVYLCMTTLSLLNCTLSIASNTF